MPGNNKNPLDLIDAAILAAWDSEDFSVITLLLTRGATIGKNALDLFQTRLRNLRLGPDPAPLSQALQSFLLSLNQLVKSSPGILPLASVVWSAAMKTGWSQNFSRDFISELDPRIWIVEDALSEWAFRTITLMDANSLHALLSDGRFDLLSIRAEDGGSLLHVATSAPGYHCNIRDMFVIATQLLNAGFSPSATNDDGQSPLHVWDWGCWVESDQDSELLENLMRAFVQAEFDIRQTDRWGRNVLHANLDKPRELQAIINVADDEALDGALRGTNKRKGFTPLIEALTSGREEAVVILLQYCRQKRGDRPKDRQADGGTSNLLVEILESKVSVRGLVDSGICVGWNGQCPVEVSPLHGLSWETTAHCVKLLKALYPHSCETRVKERLPLENYLDQCIGNIGDQNKERLLASSSFHEVVLELATLDPAANNDNQLKAPTWEFLTTLLQREQNYQYCSRLLGPTVVYSLTQLGYLHAYEDFTNQSGLAYMILTLEKGKLRPRGRDIRGMDDFRSLSSASIERLVTSTRHWPKFTHSPAAAMLLRAAFLSCDLGILNLMLKKGLDLRCHSPGYPSCFEEIFRWEMGMPKLKHHQSIVQMLLDYAGPSCLNELDTASNAYGPIHLAAAGGSAWVVEELIRRGANPNLRTGPVSASQPALVCHLLDGKFDSARALLHHGADPTARDARGINAALAVARSGCVEFLEELVAAENSGKFPWRIDWQRTCIMPRGRNQTGTISGLSALHLSASFGKIECLKFYLEKLTLGGIDGLSSKGYTPLMNAASAGHEQEADYLCRQGAQIDFQCPFDGQTALHLAVVAGSFDTVHVLLEHGARSLRDHEGMTPWILAHKLGNQTMLKVLPNLSDGTVDSHVTRASVSSRQPALRGQERRQRSLTL
jgi:ankyrin repeat protein